MGIEIVAATPADYAAIHRLNEASTPHVSSITPEELAALAAMCFDFSLVRDDEGVVAFLMLMRPGQPYQSLNYLWFSEHYRDFVYVDRIAVAERAKGKGIGRALYQHAERISRSLAPVLTCEVNLDPPNPDSLEFHRRMGFVEVGRQKTEGGTKTVSLLVKTLEAPSLSIP